MLVRFWGTRGSIPVAANTTALRKRLKTVLMTAGGRDFKSDGDLDAFLDNELPFPVSHTFGGNSSCVEIEAGSDEYLLCDLGSGVREFGEKMMSLHGPDNPQTYNVFLSHLHWDHIMGFPFLIPAYVPGNKIRIHSCHDDANAAFLYQQSEPCFPVPLEFMDADLEFIKMEPGKPLDVAGVTVTAKRQYHPGDSYGYRFEASGKSVVYSTDSEHKQNDPDEIAEFAAFFKEADLVIFDAMYTLAEAFTAKEDWGHSSNIIGIELCQEAKAKEFCMFHHEPTADDETLYNMFQEAVKIEEMTRTDHRVEISIAYDGAEIKV